ncbi:MAG: GHKL domain-containing protein [Clostridium sp.]|nr:GHKL domain-containing protein [Clostridium sp.]
MNENILSNFENKYEKDTCNFQENLIAHQYEEIKNIYLDMRGWRHDYHNHIQTIKAYLTFNEIEAVNKYLNTLDKSLDEVDSYVKSGNLILDAILNSKISLAKKKNIKIVCKADVSNTISLRDVDLCVILGNLLDNAIEASELIPIEDRFIRIYITILKKQLYISIQNSAREDLTFNEKNYISTKRGNHGFGMKRVKILVEKYNGYLNLQNESGIFASEVTIPITLSK